MIPVRKRPTLAEIGSLSVRSVVSSRNGDFPMRTTAAPISIREPHAVFDCVVNDGPPVDIMEEPEPTMSDAILSGWDTPAMPAVASTVPEVQVAEMTQADKIEMACEKIDPAVRAFIEGELRARFVAAWVVE